MFVAQQGWGRQSLNEWWAPPRREFGDGEDMTGDFVGVQARERRADPACPVSTLADGSSQCLRAASPQHHLQRQTPPCDALGVSR